jgi:type I restriction enzyme S subunit
MPDYWKIYKLSDVIISANTGLDAIKRAPIVDEDTGIKCLRIQDVSQVKEFKNWGFTQVSPENYKKFSLKEGEIIIARTGNTIGVNMFIKNDVKSVFNNGLIRIRINKNICDPKYVYYNFRTNIFKAYIDSIAFGTSTQPNMQINSLLSFDFFVPPLQEQKAIASILSALDDKIEMNLQMNKTLEEMAMALYKHWFVDFGPFQNGNFVESELGMIPEGWEVNKIGDVIETLGGGTPSTSENKYWENGDILWYSPTDLTREKSLFSFETAKKITPLGLQKSSAKMLPPYSLLMSSRATIGLLTINTQPACTNQGFITMLPNNKLSIYQLYFWVKQNQDLIISKSNGSTFKEISKSSFRDLDVIIGKEIDSYLKETKDIFNHIENNIEENQTLTTLRESLLPKLISGEVSVKDAEQTLIASL